MIYIYIDICISVYCIYIYYVCILISFHINSCQPESNIKYHRYHIYVYIIIYYVYYIYIKYIYIIYNIYIILYYVISSFELQRPGSVISLDVSWMAASVRHQCYRPIA